METNNNNTNTKEENEDAQKYEKVKITRFLIIGATGASGLPLVRQAVESGHHVTVLVRSPEKLPEELREKVTVIQGSSTDPETVMKALESITHVFVVVGHVKGSPKDLMTSTLNNVIAGIKVHNVKQLIYLAGAAVHVESDKKSFGQKFMGGIMNLVAKDMMSDFKNVPPTIEKEKDFKWVVARPPRLTKGSLTRKIKADKFISMGPLNSLSREDLAYFMLSQVDNDEYNHQFPMVTAK